MDMGSIPQYEFCDVQSNSLAHQDHLNKGWEVNPDKVQEGNTIPMRRIISKSVVVKTMKDLE